MKCNAKHKPQHRTHYVHCEKVPGHKGQHAAYDNGQAITWNDKDTLKPRTPDLVSIERESLEALLQCAQVTNVRIDNKQSAIEDAQRVLGHHLANGTPLKSAEEIIEERTRSREVVLPRPSSLESPSNLSDAQRAAQSAAIERRERKPTVNGALPLEARTSQSCKAQMIDPLAWCILPSDHAGKHEWISPTSYSAQEIKAMIEARRGEPQL